MSTEKVFLPHSLKTIEVDIEKKIFRVNGEDFGKGCAGFSIWCDEPDTFHIRMEIDTTVKFGTYEGINQTSVSEHPVRGSWHESSNQ